MHAIARAAVVGAGVGSAATIICSQLGVGLDGGDSSKTTTTKEDDKVPEVAQPMVIETMTPRYSEVFDVIVVGSGAAGLMAAISALWANPELKVVVLEKCATVGGTTAKSGGIFWLPGNVLMDADPRDAAIRLMAREGFPTRFDAAHPTLGLSEDVYDRIVQYYDVGQAISRQFVRKGVGLAPFLDHQGRAVYDYTYEKIAQGDNVAPAGRGLGVGMPAWQVALLAGVRAALHAAAPLIDRASASAPVLKELRLLDTFGIDLGHGVGVVMVDRLAGVLRSLGGTIRTSAGVDALLVAPEGARAEGVRTLNGELLSARRGVVFATGGFSHHREWLTAHVERAGKPVFRTGAAPGCTGDFHRMCLQLGVELEHMDQAWFCEAHWVEPAVASSAAAAVKQGGDKAATAVPWEAPSCLFQLRGDSFFVVAGDGRRVYDEKAPYDERAKVHFYNPRRNRIMFMIGDQRVVDLFGSDACVSWPCDPMDPLYVVAPTMKELGAAIRKRYPVHVADAAFEANLESTCARFNEFARTGVDEDFGRGRGPHGRQWTFTDRAMHPLSATGPYYALALSASIIDTKGGARVDNHQMCVREDGTPVARLFAAGNAASPVSGEAYISGGHTLGSALVSGYVAGLSAACMFGPKL